MRSRRGSALVYAMVAVALSGALIVVVDQLISTSSKEQQVMAVRNMRDDIGRQILAAASLPSTWRVTADALGSNHRLRRCLGLRNGGCPVQTYTVPLWVESARTGSGSQRYLIAGDGTGRPVYYDKKGFTSPACTPQTCPFEAISTFEPICPGGGCATGRPAVALKVGVQVRVANGAPKLIPNMPYFQMSTLIMPDETSPTYNAATDERKVRVNEILGAGYSQLCNPGSRQTGVEVDGTIKCECFGQFPLAGYDAEGKPLCDTQDAGKCPEGTALRGLQSDGSPLCETVAEGFVCDRVRRVNRNGYADCGQKYRLRAISDPGVCYVRQTGDDDDDDGRVECPGISITCCTLRVSN